MPKVTFIQPDGMQTVLEADTGTSVMRTAAANGVPGIVAECGGSAMCATCHVYVEDAYLDGLPEVSEVEDEMLDCTASARCANSRLSCQLNIESDIAVRIPEAQV
ncbi:2Fe-2S iron-sulfur cluster-binding protein [Arthrobacter sp. I2-34]|uniref:2Fe-2S iron-sulfur cluster-binding protein n=1 Tax=Arthrobacter hankyongi TaxID=2904801 RepID=A0ABS9L3Z4_9MICC|nr:2Fe-2S iron-sulfur cluster-binding protein [Arthrobacter hankyongi]MCG2621356.1 2Fe-2S iron-sulfur cluster-binding protein [Arthrobacter hankyongi]